MEDSDTRRAVQCCAGIFVSPNTLSSSSSSSSPSHYSPYTFTRSPTFSTNIVHTNSNKPFLLSHSPQTQSFPNFTFHFSPEMQPIHSIAGADRRLRPNHHNHHQPLKCPRCDSLNTKFCYYNNYNLSQPRHFCKNCRRYWTKGGVLRNVPVGGGCRKSKRSNKPKTTATNTTNNNSSSNNNTTTNNPSSSSETAPATALPEPERNSNSHSSSESSTLTVAATEAMSAPTSNAVSNKALLNVRESKLFANANNPSLESGGIFSEIGSFTSLIASNNEALGFGFGNSSNSNNNILGATPFRFGVSHQQGNDQVQVAPGGGHGQWQNQQNHQEFVTASFLDHTVPPEFSSLQHKTGHHGGFGSLDWQPGGDQGLFDLANGVDQPYWTHTHWSDQDNPPLFHLP